MKRLATLIAAAGLVLTGCGGEPEVSAPAPTVTVTESTTMEVTVTATPEPEQAPTLAYGRSPDGTSYVTPVALSMEHLLDILALAGLECSNPTGGDPGPGPR